MLCQPLVWIDRRADVPHDFRIAMIDQDVSRSNAVDAERRVKTTRFIRIVIWHRVALAVFIVSEHL
jgi:hypothetical protein